MPIVRVGLLGLGEVAQSIHLPVLSDLRTRFAIAGVFDASQSLMDLAVSRHAGVRAFSSAEALINDPEIDAVFILTADETHSRFARQAIAANKHVLLEKPACLTVREIDELLPLLTNYSKIFFVAYMRRYAPAFLTAKAEMPDPAEITHVRIFDLITVGRSIMRHSQEILYPTDVDPALLSEGAARKDALLREVVGKEAPADLVRAYHGLLSLSSHHLSAMRELLGEPRGVLAAHRTNGGANTSVTFDYGHYAAYYDAVMDEVGLFDAMIEVRTNTKRMRVVYDTPYIRSLPTRLEITEGTPDGVRSRTFGPFYEDAFTNELKAFHAHIVDGTRPKTDLADSRKDLALYAAIVERMKQGQSTR
ncbi:Gfo/Idh/MocA family protein [Lichenifustis flavocetrariae]|uniref:Gfo/Idh/MocA family oxidoreductase n=1 Tax=Lichenifustis flavocetrariae TaxID=2949735 RepID=A0AA41YRT2_9HYPH|nr:Gfo/Idh/MocA family oxidoreductase [Lichenifustis flavocetrariae]MCW6506999.1 Gfo/Idh/MocA family oxidoreductase [Lichenifustis flavocetrariae]